MALFEMRRFQPEKEEAVSKAEEDDADQEEKLAEALRKRLKKKAKKKKLKEVEATEGDAEEDFKPPEGKKAKPDNGNVGSTEKSEEDASAEASKPVGKKKQRKKKKATTSDGDDKAGPKDFTVLGSDSAEGGRKGAVRRVLPEWLAKPDIVTVDFKEQQVAVGELEGLDDETTARLRSQGVTHFFPVQRQVIPHLLDSPASRLLRPGDVCVSAPTGSGKTLAFVLPVVQALKRRAVPRVRALVVLPVQDLAAQVHAVFQTYTEGTGLRVRLLSAAKPFAQEQYELVRRGAAGWHSLADVVVATPGRLVDHLKTTEGFSLAHLRYLVVDEADRVMEDMQNDWLAAVEEAACGGDARAHRPSQGKLTAASAHLDGKIPLQKLLFSATLSQNPEQLEQLRLFEPKLFTSVVKPSEIVGNNLAANEPDVEPNFVGQYTTPAELKEYFVVCQDTLKKPQVLYHLMKTKGMKRTLIFAKSLEHTHKLTVLLKQYGISVEELSSQVKGERRRVLKRLSDGSVDALVCSDALARGIDVGGQVDFVVSYDCPDHARTYVHRAGRTARAGHAGAAVTLCERGELRRFRKILREAGKAEGAVEEWEVPEEQLDAGRYEEASEKTALVLQEEKGRGKKSGSRKKRTKNK